MAKKALTVAMIVLLVLGYPINLIFLLVPWVSATPGIYTLLFTCLYAVLYLWCWVRLLFAGLKRNSKILQSLYQIFWIVATVYFVIAPQIPLASFSMEFLQFCGLYSAFHWLDLMPYPFLCLVVIMALLQCYTYPLLFPFS